jgi:uncharacterized OB-fold protein
VRQQNRAPAAVAMPGGPRHILPRVDETTAFFWHSGRDGVLCFLRCADCGWYLHPPGPVCPSCLGRTLVPTAVSGSGRVHSFTINAHPWYEGQEVPYVVAIVELPEQEGLRLTTNLVDVVPDEVTMEMPVTVVFAQVQDVFLPLFTPDRDGRESA